MWRSLVRGVGVSAVLVAIATSCAKGADATDLGDVAVPDPDSGTDGGSIRFDGGSSGGDGGPSNEDTGSGGCTGKVVINELQNNGANAAEFIELYNTGTCAVALGGWKIKYASAAGNAGVNPYAFGTGDSIAAKSFLLLGNDKFVGKKDGELTSGLGNTGGQVGLVDDTDKVVDALGYATGTKGMYTEATPAPSPPTNGSVGRKSDGVDSNDNADDFKTFTTHSAGVSNP